MGLNFSGNTHVVTHGTTGTNNMTEMTVMALARPTSFAMDHLLAAKTDGVGFAAYRDFYFNTAGGLSLELGRASTELKAVSTATGIITANNWWWGAFQVKTNGVNGDQKLFYSALNGSLTEVGGYSTQNVGSGAVPDDSSYAFSIGNSATAQTFWGMRGDMAFVAVWNRLLTVEEMRTQQLNPFPTPGCQLMTQLGWPGTTARDYSPNLSNGTVTGATAANHPPILNPFHQMIQRQRPYRIAAAAPSKKDGLFFAAA